jgi:hypothetical protein
MYHQLPSTVLREGTLFDILVADTLAEYEMQQSVAPGQRPVPKMTTEEMQTMLNQARNNYDSE